MSVTVLNISTAYQMPAENPIVFVLSASNYSNKINYRLGFDVYSAGTNTRLFTQEKYLIPDQNYAFFDISKNLKNYINSTINFDLLTNPLRLSENEIKYDIKPFERYSYYWPWEAFAKYSTYSATSEWSGYTFLVNTTTDHYFETGQTISVTSTTINDNFYILKVIDSKKVLINFPYPDSFLPYTTVQEAGSGFLSNLATTKFTGTTSTNYDAYEGKFNLIDYKSYVKSAYTLSFNYVYGGTPPYFLTNCPQLGWELRQNNFMSFKMYCDSLVNDASILKIDTKDVTGGTKSHTIGLSGYSINIENALYSFDVGLGTANLNNYKLYPGTSQPIIDSNTVKYSAYTQSAGGTRSSQIYSFDIDRVCTKYTNYELVFRDQLGSYIPMNFKLVSRETLDIERKNYLQSINGNFGTKWSYNTWDRGLNDYNIIKDRSLQLNTDWMSDTNYAFVEDLMMSKEIYIKYDGNNYIPVIIKDKNYEFKKFINDDMFNCNINVQIANGL